MSLEPGNAEESFLTVAEVAELLKLNQQTVRNWIEQGSLPALRVGRRVRIRRSDFDRLLEAGYTGGSRSSADAAGTSRASADTSGGTQTQAQTAAQPQPPGQSAEDFWGGEPVGTAEPPNGRRTDR
jgi:excisionase family DNA binding protein